MADAWGGSFGQAFGQSFGSGTVVSANPKNMLAKSFDLYQVSATRKSTLPSSALLGVWANDGREKILREEIRLSQPVTAIAPQDTAAPILNRVWNGSSISLIAARRETVGFMLILEAPTFAQTGLSVEVSDIIGPSATITTQARTTANLTDYRGRNIEVFVMRYLRCDTISLLSYDFYNELHVPHKLRSPSGPGPWTSRPAANKHFPEICIPHEVVPTFNIAPNESQSVWIDIHVPAGQIVGNYTGNVLVKKDGQTISTVPLSLRVRNITLPTTPANKHVAYIQEADVMERYTGERFPSPGSANHTLGRARTRDYMRMLHRHSVTPSVGRDDALNTVSPPPADDVLSLQGTLYSNDATHQYDGPGLAQAENFAWLGPYGTSWKNDPQATYDTNLVAWVNWFSANAPQADYAMYLTDEPQHTRITAVVRGVTTRITAINGISALANGESVIIGGALGLTQLNGTWVVSNVSVADPFVSFDITLNSTSLSDYPIPNTGEVSRDYVTVRTWVDKVLAATPPGNSVKTFITTAVESMRKFDSRINISAAWIAVANQPEYGNAVAAHFAANVVNQVWHYNGKRIASGTFAMEDEGVAFEVITAAMLKHNINRWFYWNVSYYRDFQNRGGAAQLTNVYTDAITFGSPGTGNDNYGPRYGFRTTQNDGVLIYPGQDVFFPSDAPGIDAPVASLRLKLLRNAVQAAGVATQARVLNAASTNARINARVPIVLWETDVDDEIDPSYRNTGISWSIKPNDWADDRKFYYDIVDPAGA